MKFKILKEETLEEKSNKEHNRAVRLCKNSAPDYGWKPYSVFHHMNYDTDEGFLIDNNPNKLAPLMHTLFHFCKENNIFTLETCFNYIKNSHICQVTSDACKKIDINTALKIASKSGIEDDLNIEETNIQS